jgi:FHA domain/Domain of unknown function (DUF1707)
VTRPPRASVRQRDQTVARLGGGYARGELSTGTFELRVEAAFAARTVADLRRLTEDLRDFRAATGRALATLLRREDEPVAANSAAPPPPAIQLALPHKASPRLVVGRSRSCEFVVRDPTVSRRHALMLRSGHIWLLTDLNSTNGTWIGDTRVLSAVVRPGDTLVLGSARVRLLAPAVV